MSDATGATRPRHLHSFSLGAVLAAALAALVVLLLPSRRMTAPVLTKPERLSDTVRAALRTQMRTHARGMMELVATVTVLDYAAVGASVQRVLDEPRVARPLTGDATELNAALPERFFVMQDQLRVELQQLANAAAHHEPDATARALGAAVQTCVRCHDAYLTGR